MVLTQVFQAPKWWNNIGIHQKIRTRFFFCCHLPDIIHSASKDRSGISYTFEVRGQEAGGSRLSGSQAYIILKWDKLAIICKVTFLQIQTYPPLFTFNGQLFNGKTLKLYYQIGKKKYNWNMFSLDSYGRNSTSQLLKQM